MHQRAQETETDTTKFGVAAPTWLVMAVEAERQRLKAEGRDPGSRSACVVQAMEEWVNRRRAA